MRMLDASLQSFADSVREIAPRIGPYRGSRAYLSDVCWRLGMRKTAFDEMAIECHRRGLLTLARCDMPQDLDPKRLQLSHIAHLGADFHFVVSTK